MQRSDAVAERVKGVPFIVIAGQNTPGDRRAPSMKLKTMLITAGCLIFLGVGLYLGFTEGIEPSLGPCSKYSLICLR